MKKKHIFLLLIMSLMIIPANAKAETLINLCSNSNFIKIINYLRTIIAIIIIGSTLVMIVTGMINIAKVVIVDKADEELKKALTKLKNQIVIVCIIVLIPSFFNWLFFTDNFFTRSNKTLTQCVENLSKSTVDDAQKDS